MANGVHIRSVRTSWTEDYHQQYLAKNPHGYCPNHSTGVKLPDDFVVTPLQYVD
jgi:peptide methionine sulfoxide reductase MsrA